MPTQPEAEGAQHYTLATGAAGARRLGALHQLYGPGTRAMALRAGLRPGMKAVDFGCGIGMVSRMFADIVGPTGHITGVDLNQAQIDQARELSRGSYPNVEFRAGGATATGLESNQFDFASCRFLLLHLPDPLAALAEMRRVLRPGGILLAEDADMASNFSLPATAINRFGELFSKLGAARGLDFSLGNRLHELVMAMGFGDLDVNLNHPAHMQGDERRVAEWTLEEAGEGVVGAGICSREELQSVLAGMRAAAANPRILIAGVRMMQVAARKPGAKD